MKNYITIAVITLLITACLSESKNDHPVNKNEFIITSKNDSLFYLDDSLAIKIPTDFYNPEIGNIRMVKKDIFDSSYTSKALGFKSKYYTNTPELLYQIDISSLQNFKKLTFNNLEVVNIKNPKRQYILFPFNNTTNQGVFVYVRPYYYDDIPYSVGEMLINDNSFIKLINEAKVDSVFTTLSIIDPIRFNYPHKIISTKNIPFNSFKVDLKNYESEDMVFYAATLFSNYIVLGKQNLNTIIYDKVFTNEKFVVIGVENNFNQKIKWCVEELDASKGEATIRLKYTSFEEFIKEYKNLIKNWTKSIN